MLEKVIHVPDPGCCAKLFLGGAPLPQPEGALGSQLGSVGCKTLFPVTPFILLFSGYPIVREAVCKRFFLRRSSFAAVYSTSLIILITTTSRFLLFRLCLLLIVIPLIQKVWDIQVAE